MGVWVHLPYVMRREECSGSFADEVTEYELRFGTRFSRLVVFEPQMLQALHRPGEPPEAVWTGDPGARRLVGTLTEVANAEVVRLEDRDRYLEALRSILRGFGPLPAAAAERAGAVIAPRREGAILAEHLGCLPPQRSWTPQAKRIPFKGGLAVGLDDGIPPDRHDHIVLIDGVVASGVTALALLELASQPAARIDLFTCHSTAQGVSALRRYAGQRGLDLRIHVGHVSGVLDSHYYAVDPQRPDRFVLGDIGDTISPLFRMRPSAEAGGGD